MPVACALRNSILPSELAEQGRLFSSSGNRDLDASLNVELLNMSETFGVLPGFKFYDDWEGPNAWAASESILDNTSGTVVFGTTLLDRLLNDNSWGGMSVAGVLAHEFGHILQYSSNFYYYQKLRPLHGTTKPGELHADYLAGYYLGDRESIAQGSIGVFAQELFNMGDLDFTNPFHHGLPEERRASMLVGYAYGKNHPDAIMEAAAAGYDYLADRM